MAQIPQINNPITAKNYNYSSRPMDPNTEPFDIVKLTGVQGAGSGSASSARSRLEMGNRELIPLQVQVAKDPTLAVETLKDLLNIEVLNQALINGRALREAGGSRRRPLCKAGGACAGDPEPGAAEHDVQRPRVL